MNSFEEGRLVAETVLDPEGRLRSDPDGAEWIWQEHGKWVRDLTEDRSVGDSFKWNENWLHIPRDLLMKVFTFEECLKLQHGTVIASQFSYWFDENHSFLRKILFAHWHYGCTHGWNMFIDHLEGFKRLHTDLPDFDVRITHTRTVNQAAWAHDLRDLYLDASFGLLLYYKGEHVLTVGFAPMYRGILVAQVQLRQKKGNRFLYKLPGHYIDVALDILARAFDGPMWLITGESAVSAIRKAYGNKPCTVGGEIAERIQSLYSRPLDAYDRLPGATCSYEDRTYVQIVRRVAKASAAA